MIPPEQQARMDELLGTVYKRLDKLEEILSVHTDALQELVRLMQPKVALRDGVRSTFTHFFTKNTVEKRNLSMSPGKCIDGYEIKDVSYGPTDDMYTVELYRK